jgi:hypothetical protein
MDWQQIIAILQCAAGQRRNKKGMPCPAVRGRFGGRRGLRQLSGAHLPDKRAALGCLLRPTRIDHFATQRRNGEARAIAAQRRGFATQQLYKWKVHYRTNHRQLIDPLPWRTRLHVAQTTQSSSSRLCADPRLIASEVGAKGLPVVKSLVRDATGKSPPSLSAPICPKGAPELIVTAPQPVAGMVNEMQGTLEPLQLAWQEPGEASAALAQVDPLP